MSAMRKVAFRNLRAHKVRLTLTLISVILGTAFVAGSFVFTDTLKRTFDTIFATSDKGIDTRVQAKNSFQAGVPTDLLTRVKHVPGVRTVQVDINSNVVLIDPHGKKIDTGGAPSTGGAWRGKGESIQPVPTFTSGHAPTKPNEVVVNDSVASKHHLGPGDRVKVVVPNASVVSARVVGVYKVSFDTGGYVGVLFDKAQAQSLFTDGHHYSSLDAAAKSGVDEKTLTKRIAAILPAGLEAKTGTQVRDADSQGIATALSFITYILLGFGIVALLVGTFIIYNTFSMIVAQRQRELALLRAVGAGRGQISRSVVFEAAVTGILGSVLGLGGGIGLAYGLRSLLDALGTGLPGGTFVLGARTIILTLVLGTLVTIIAAYAPARRASRIAPVAALQAEFATPTGLVRRTLLGLVVAALAVIATVAGYRADSTGSAAGLTGLGLLGACVAVMLLAPLFARWIIAPIGRVVGRPFGLVGRLARTNAVRNPRRTAATGFALTLGLVLVSGIAVIGASAKATVNKLFDDNVRADYILSTQTELNVPIGAANAARRVPGVASLTELHDIEAKVDGKSRGGTGVDGPLRAVFDVHVDAGKLNPSGHNMLVSAKTAKERHWTVGTRHTFDVPGLKPITTTVTGVYANDDLIGPWVVSGDVYRALTPRNEWADEVALVHAKPDTDLDTLRTKLDDAVNGYYVVNVQNQDEFKGEAASMINGLLGLIYGLLGLAIIIAILGIINTQALAVIERRREIGMLRAVGMQRRQVRRTIYLESLLIAVFGAALGLAIGLAFGALFQHVLSDQGLSALAVPWGQAILFLVVAAVVGVLAALWPGRRAAKTPPLEAIATA